MGDSPEVRLRTIVCALAAVAAAILLGGGAPAIGAGSVLVGDQIVEAGHDQNGAGVAEAFRATASATGSVGKLTVYVDTGSTATT